MFEKELERVRKHLRQHLATPQPYVSLQSVMSAEAVHPAFRTFFQAEVAWWVHEEQAIRTSNPRFETGHQEFRDLFRELDGLYARHARFDHEELNATIDAAAKTRLNYLCRPRTTLKWFVFRGEPTKPLQEILLRLNYLYDHRYLINGFEQWARTRGSDTPFEILSVIEFERIVEKIDNDAILDLSQGEFVRLLEPMYEFFATYNPDLPVEAVPTEAVIIYLDDKGAVPISQSLERLLYREDLRFLTRSKLLEVIDDVIASIDSTGMPTASYETVTLPEPAHPMMVGEALSLAADVGLDEEGPALEEIVPTRPTVEAGVDTTVTKAMPPVDIVEATPGTDPEYSAPSVVDQPVPIEEGPSQDVQFEQLLNMRRDRFATLLDERTQGKVIKKLFGGNTSIYSSVVDAVLESDHWKEAAGKIDRFFAEHRIEPNSAVAMEFCQALHRVFIVS
ncbi:MAG: hypothetical protein JSS89_00510 [Bacteroidetes bacterium]|nr:hypothetical protein [Bacteroidota bacterium]